MSNWKENKMVGIAAAVLAVVAIGVVVQVMSGRNKLSTQDVEKLQEIDTMVQQEMQNLPSSPDGGQM